MHWFLLGLLILFVLFDVYYHWFSKAKWKDYLYIASIVIFAAATFVMSFFTGKSTFCFVMVLVNEITALLKVLLFVVAKYIEMREVKNEEKVKDEK